MNVTTPPRASRPRLLIVTGWLVATIAVVLAHDARASTGQAEARRPGATMSAQAGAPHPLNVFGVGMGRVRVDPPGVVCGLACWEYPANVEVVIAPLPGPGFRLASWRGCDRLDGDRCVVRMLGERSVAVAFVLITAAPAALSITRGGGGAVRSAPPGIDCGLTCRGEFPREADVTLSATPDTGFATGSWNGCDRTDGDTCVVRMNADRNVSMSFAPVASVALTIGMELPGAVLIEPSGVRCDGPCRKEFPSGTMVTLTALPPKGFAAAWSSCPAPRGHQCVVKLTHPMRVNVRFVSESSPPAPVPARARARFPLSVNVSGSGSLVSVPAGIACPAACSTEFEGNLVVTLVARPVEGFIVAEWRGCERADGPRCLVTVSAVKTIGLTFRPAPRLRVEPTPGLIVSVTPPGAVCPPACEHSYPRPTAVYLVARDVGSASWSACKSAEPHCFVKVDGPVVTTVRIPTLERMLRPLRRLPGVDSRPVVVLFALTVLAVTAYLARRRLTLSTLESIRRHAHARLHALRRGIGESTVWRLVRRRRALADLPDEVRNLRRELLDRVRAVEARAAAVQPPLARADSLRSDRITVVADKVAEVETALKQLKDFVAGLAAEVALRALTDRIDGVETELQQVVLNLRAPQRVQEDTLPHPEAALKDVHAELGSLGRRMSRLEMSPAAIPSGSPSRSEAEGGDHLAELITQSLRRLAPPQRASGSDSEAYLLALRRCAFALQGELVALPNVRVGIAHLEPGDDKSFVVHGVGFGPDAPTALHCQQCGSPADTTAYHHFGTARRGEDDALVVFIPPHTVVLPQSFGLGFRWLAEPLPAIPRVRVDAVEHPAELLLDRSTGPRQFIVVTKMRLRVGPEPDA